MNKDIPFTSFTAVPSDYESTDGELTQCHNLINENGAFHSLLPPKELLELPDGYRVIAIHSVTGSDKRHFIITNNSSLYWIKEGDEFSTSNVMYDYTGEVSSVQCIGNTVVALCEEHMFYMLWKDDAYIKLGDHLPNIEVSFGLMGKPRLYSQSHGDGGTFVVDFDRINDNALYNEFSDDNKTKITGQVFAKLNMFLAEQTVNKGRFALPFLVRYALRLYDGTLVCHSAPILMNPSTTPAPIVLWKRAYGDEDNEDWFVHAEMDIMLVAASLDYQLVVDGDAEYNRLDLWSDIVKSVDVFISKPIYTYDQEGKVTSLTDTDNLDSVFIGALDISSFGGGGEDCVKLPLFVDGQEWTSGTAGGRGNILGQYYCEWKYSDLYAMYFSDNRKIPTSSVALPEFSADKVRETVENTCNFYFLHSIDLDALKASRTSRTDIEVPDEYLQSLTSRGVMTDDYLSHDRITASFSHTYNNRLNLAGIKRNLYHGFSTSTMFARCSHYYGKSVETIEVHAPSLAYPYGVYQHRFKLTMNHSFTYTMSVTVFVKENNKTYSLQAYSSSYMTTEQFMSRTVYTSQADADADTNGQLTKRSWGCYFFYPNTNAYLLRIRDNYGTYEVDLKPHDFLNGAYASIPYGITREPNVSKTIGSVEAENVVDVPNKIYTSEVNNPFVFPVTGINTIGTGEIRGIAAATKALSQGQFGQFPLYAFCTDGVWALEVSSSGTYSAKQPVTRDVCISADSITQIDSAVLFATDRGIMEVAGSQTQCLTDLINGYDFFDIASLPGLASLFPEGLPKVDCTFAEYRVDARIAYDYINQRIIIFNAGKSYAYVYSMRSKMWGIMASSLTSVINSYPEAYAMAHFDGANHLVDISRSDVAHVPGLIVTRPIKLDAGSMLKTFDSVFLRGFFPKGAVQVALYGSRDNINWHLVHSAKEHYLRGFRGSPYKFYRIVALTDLAVGETILGASVQYTPRLVNQPR